MAYITKKQTDNGIKPIGSNLYGICTTGASTVGKTVSMPDLDVLVEGVTIHVYFQYANTASNPTLQVGSTEAKPIKYNGQFGGSWEAGGFISFTYYSGAWIQNDITIGGITYTFSISGHTMTITGSDGSVQTITLPNDSITYTLSKSGSTILLTGSDGSSSSVTDADTLYGLSFVNGQLSLVTDGNVASVNIPDDNTTYSISISGHTVTLTGSDGSTSTVTVPDNDTTYALSKSDNTITLTGSDGSTSSVTVDNLFIAAYGKSTYAEVLDAYKKNRMVYCRCGTGSNPATGNQLRMAFLAYVNNEATPTEFEFQYYRSVATHSDSQQGDQVYVYKLKKTTGWEVTVRSAFTKIVAGTGLQSSYSNGVLTISLA